MTNPEIPFFLDVSLVSRLIADQFPQWANLPLRRFNSTGTVNAIYRLGEEMVVRFPLDEGGALQLQKEHHWLPSLAPRLPLAIPTPLAEGRPTKDYPWHWSVYQWIKGDNAIEGHIDNPYQAAATLANFVTTLQSIDTAGGPPPGDHNFGRGFPLAMRDEGVREVMTKLHNTIDTDAATSAWELALYAQPWQGRPVWIHGDLLAGNLLVENGQLSAIIDFGGLGVGDPACDWMFAWNLLNVEERKKLRSTLSVDDSTWIRGSGWALSVGLFALPYYQARNPVFAGVARRLIDEVVADYKKGLL